MGALFAALLLAAPALAEAEACGPFDERYPAVAVQIARADTGVAPAPQGDAGAIITLPAPPGQLPDPPAGEALLALPKNPDGSLPTNFELAPGARIVESYFSSVLCATVARVVGPASATPQQLVPSVPDSATVVPNSVYTSAQAEVTSAQAEVTPASPPAPRPDPYRALQYGFDQSGVADARARSNGTGVRVAVLDSAPEVGHADLDIALDLLEGGPSEAAAVHGTLVTGVIGAVEGNGFGMAGLAPGAEVIAVPICTPVGATATDRCMLYHLLRGVDRAWEREAQVVNLSIVGPPSPLLERAMSRLDELGVLTVAASGNDGGTGANFPAAYPSVIGVGAIDRDRRRYERSNTGPGSELLAPGVEVLSAVPGNAFAFGSGTSFATAHVSGVLGVLLGAGVEPAAARTALFQQAHESADGSLVLLPAVCDVLARLGSGCSAP